MIYIMAGTIQVISIIASIMDKLSLSEFLVIWGIVGVMLVLGNIDTNLTKILKREDEKQ